MTNTLATVVVSARYKPGWSVSLRTMHHHPHLWVSADVIDSNPPHGVITIEHILPAPAALIDNDDVAACRRWVYDALGGVDNHERGEWLWFGDERPFLPTHGEGDPYEEPPR